MSQHYEVMTAEEEAAGGRAGRPRSHGRTGGMDNTIAEGNCLGDGQNENDSENEKGKALLE